jgi:hypothetical protein
MNNKLVHRNANERWTKAAATSKIVVPNWTLDKPSDSKPNISSLGARITWMVT